MYCCFWATLKNYSFQIKTAVAILENLAEFSFGPLVTLPAIWYRPTSCWFYLSTGWVDIARQAVGVPQHFDGVRLLSAVHEAVLAHVMHGQDGDPVVAVVVAVCDKGR